MPGTCANTATVSGTPPTGAAVSGVDSTDTPIASAPGISLVKAAGTLDDTDANGPTPATPCPTRSPSPTPAT